MIVPMSNTDDDIDRPPDDNVPGRRGLGCFMAGVIGMLAVTAAGSDTLWHPRSGDSESIVPIVLWAACAVTVAAVTVVRIARRDWDYLSILFLVGGVLALVGGYCAPIWNSTFQ